MRLSLAFLGFSTQVLQTPLQPPSSSMATSAPEFAFKESKEIFSPKDLVQLGRPGQALANAAGDLALVPFSKFSFDGKKNEKSVFVISLESDAKPIQPPLEKGGDTFWLTARTFAHAVAGDEETEIYSYDVNIDAATSDKDAKPFSSPVLVGKIPTKSASNFRYNAESGTFVFSASVYPDGNLTTVKEQDKQWEERGNSAFVYDTTYVRHWDVWQGKKGPQLFSIKLSPGEAGALQFNGDFKSPLQGTGHYSPVEPFGGNDDFDISATHILYTTKDPQLPEAWHTKQNVYTVPIDGREKPTELTSGKQGAVHSPVFNTKGDKVAWLQLDKDGYESDRAKIVIYDLKTHVRFTLTQDWDRSPDALAFSKDDDFLYLTAGDEAKVKVFTIPVPATPPVSTTHPKLDSKFTKPVAITHSRAASGLQTLPSGRILFSQSSFTSPNDAFIARDLKTFESAILSGKIAPETIQVNIQKLTNFSENDLKSKNLGEGEEFCFKGAHDKHVQGWALKPHGWKAGEKKKWPVVLLIHGGPQGAWEDQWSTRWNPNVFAHQGYFVIMINPTGSTTFGQEFTDAIAGDWGGKPFTDMIHGWKYALHRYPEIDADRAVAAGASWGGYAINWIQGHPEFGFNFKALIGHDGVFDATYNGYSTDELFFFNHEWGGRPWEEKTKKLAEKFSPINYVHKWSTPQLLIHGSKDYRLPETESIGAFHALQQLGIPSRLVIFPDENHWVLDHGNSLKWHYEVFRWFDQFVGEKK
ncbi:Alpha/Beta hydrolase protein [Crassisporium funariophilum]|nr:Alpha/Beta hydrolase protein [Crassisporium funariophilum]